EPAFWLGDFGCPFAVFGLGLSRRFVRLLCLCGHTATLVRAGARFRLRKNANEIRAANIPRARGGTVRFRWLTKSFDPTATRKLLPGGWFRRPEFAAPRPR